MQKAQGKILFIKSFQHALDGVFKSIGLERNYHIMLASFCCFIILGVILKITFSAWSVIFLSYGGILALEMMNTAVESVVDLVTRNYHPLAKRAKDIAAGAVLIWTVLSILACMFVFLPYLIELF